MPTAADPGTARPGRFEHLHRALREPERVIELKITAPITALPPSIASLVHLETLTLVGTRIEALPTALASLPKLRDLDLRGNRFATLPAVVATIPALRRLRFVESAAKNITGLGALTGLRSLALRVPGVVRDEVFSLTALEDLTLVGIAEPPDALARLNALHTLDLDAGTFADDPSWLAALTALHTLRLRGGRGARFIAHVARMGRPAALRSRRRSLAGRPRGVLRDGRRLLGNERDRDRRDPLSTARQRPSPAFARLTATRIEQAAMTSPSH